MIFNIEAEDIFEANPKLKPYKSDFLKAGESVFALSIKRMFVYLAYHVDKQSPLNDIDSYKDKSKEAMLKAGLFRRADGYPEWVEAIISGENEYVNRCKMRMLQVQYDNEWSLLVTLRTAFYSVQEDILNGEDKSKRAIDLNNEINKLLDVMNKRQMSPEERRMSLSILEDVSLGIRPEEHILEYETNGRVFEEFNQ
jgi:hypothetical protein